MTERSQPMNRDDAVREALQLLRGLFGPDMLDSVLGQIMVDDDHVEEHDTAWLVPFESVAYLLDDSDPSKACVPNVVLVPRDGAEPFIPPSAEPATTFLDEVKASGVDWVSFLR
jgi:hypothetical protein